MGRGGVRFAGARARPGCCALEGTAGGVASGQGAWGISVVFRVLSLARVAGWWEGREREWERGEKTRGEGGGGGAWGSGGGRGSPPPPPPPPPPRARRSALESVTGVVPAARSRVGLAFSYRGGIWRAWKGGVCVGSPPSRQPFPVVYVGSQWNLWLLFAFVIFRRRGSRTLGTGCDPLLGL